MTYFEWNIMHISKFKPGTVEKNSSTIGFGEFSDGLRCLISSGILYTYLNSSREQLRKIHQL